MEVAILVLTAILAIDVVAGWVVVFKATRKAQQETPGDDVKDSALPGLLALGGIGALLWWASKY